MAADASDLRSSDACGKVPAAATGMTAHGEACQGRAGWVAWINAEDWIAVRLNLASAGARPRPGTVPNLIVAYWGFSDSEKLVDDGSGRPLYPEIVVIIACTKC